ncbi:hypothetical protein OG967_47375 [Streptomyces phaeochromogenes]
MNDTGGGGAGQRAVAARAGRVGKSMMSRAVSGWHSNEVFAAQVAYAYLHASGIQVKVGSQAAITLVADVVEGRRDVRQVAGALKNWG